MSKKEEILASAFVLVIATLIVLAINIPLVYYGFQDEDSSCVEGTRGGIDLPLWTKLVGLEKIVLTVFLYVCLGLAMVGADYMLIGAGVVLVLDIFWHVIFWIWGVVILATNENNNCVGNGKGMAVTAIVWLILGKFSLLYQSAFSALVSD